MKNFLISLVKFLLPFIPVKQFFGMVLEYFDELVKRSDTKWDDRALLVLWAAFASLGLANPVPQELIDRCKPSMDFEFLKDKDDK